MQVRIVGLKPVCCALALMTPCPGLTAASKPAWVEVRSPHFVAYSDSGAKKAREALQQFEGIREAFRVLFPGLQIDPPKPVRILVLEEPEAIKRVFARAFKGKDPVKLGGYFQEGPDYAYAAVRLDLDASADHPYFIHFHEYTHLFLNFNFPRLPTWLSEGLADFYGSTQVLSDKVTLGRVPTGRLVELRSRALLPLEELFAVHPDSPHYLEGTKASLFYAESWALVHYLFMDERAQKAGLFSRYLKALDKNPDPVEAGRASLGNLSEALGTLNGYARQGRFIYLIHPLKVDLAGLGFSTRSLDEGEALAVQADFIASSQQPEAAEELLRRALALAPDRPETHAGLGMNHFRKGEPGPARACLEEALRLGSTDFRVPLYLARLANHGWGADEAERGRIAEWLDAALRLAPHSAEVRMLRCRMFSRDPATASRAIEEGRKAVELDPGNLANRANFGGVLMALGRQAEAAEIGKQLDHLAREPGEKSIAAEYADSLARYMAARKAAAEAAASPTAQGPDSVKVRRVIPGKPIRFSVPDHLTRFGQEVLQLYAAGRTEEAIAKVEYALSRTKRSDERKAFREILAQLRATLEP